MLLIRLLLFLLVLLVSEKSMISSPVKMTISEREAQIIGQKICLNETGGIPEHLVAWNTSETFASLGIGHFIWYPPGQEGPFEETFPGLLNFLQERQIELPAWLDPTSDCPWSTREEFLNHLNSQEMQDVRTLLTDTLPQQVQFIFQRLELALPKILAHVAAEEDRTFVREQFYRVAQSSLGMYALADYVNFKGEGISQTERYQGQGWGLLQVLQEMPGDSPNAVLEFANAAEFVLTRRVKNAPQERRDVEARWLPGWKARIDTYRQR